jgi:hypothetical protein
MALIGAQKQLPQRRGCRREIGGGGTAGTDDETLLGDSDSGMTEGSRRASGDPLENPQSPPFPPAPNDAFLSFELVTLTGINPHSF